MKSIIILLTVFTSLSLFAETCPEEGPNHRYLDMPINHDAPEDGTYKFHYKLQNGFDTSKRTIILLHGGPGDDMKGFDRCPSGYCFKEYSDHFNIVTVDERGTGCSLPPSESHEEFTTIHSTAEDIEYLKTFLVGSDKTVSLYGVSFGTVVATVMASNHPDSVDRLILEGSLANSSYQENLPQTIKATLDRYYESAPETLELYNEVRNKIETGKVKITPEELEEIALLGAMYSYQILSSLFPMILKELNKGIYTLYEGLISKLSNGLAHVPDTPAYQYIMCREVTDWNAVPNMYVMGVRKLCKAFENESANFTPWNALDYTNSITTPTLILTGEFDSVTAPYNGKIFDDAIMDSSFFVIPNASHGPLWEKPNCDLALIQEFLDNGNSEELNTIFNSSKCQ